MTDPAAIKRAIREYGLSALAERTGGVSRFQGMLPLLVLAGIFLTAGIIVGKFRPPRAIDARMTIGAFLIDVVGSHLPRARASAPAVGRGAKAVSRW
jgi:hypothetical protein